MLAAPASAQTDLPAEAATVHERWCAEHPSACALLADAHATAELIPPEQHRWLALTVIGAAEAGAGLEEDARRTLAEAEAEIRDVVDEGWQSGPICGVVSAQAEFGLFADALDTARRIDSGYHRAWAFVYIGGAQLAAGLTDAARASFAEALSAAFTLDRWLRRESPISGIVRAQVAAGMFADALATVRLLENDPVITGLSAEQRRTVLRRQIALAQAETGAIADAAITASLIDNAASRRAMLRILALDLVAAGQTADALTMVPDEYRWDVLREIAAAEMAAGRTVDGRRTFTQALAAADTVEDERPRARAFLSIGRAQALAGLADQARLSFSQALDAAAELTSPAGNLSILIDIAVAQAEGGLTDDARRTFAEIRAANETRGTPLHQHMVLDGIAEGQIRAGLVADAWAMAGELSSERDRSQILRQVFAAQIEAGQFDQARETAGAFVRTRPSLLRRLAAAQAGAGLFADALATAHEIGLDSPRVRWRLVSVRDIPMLADWFLSDPRLATDTADYAICYERDRIQALADVAAALAAERPEEARSVFAEALTAAVAVERVPCRAQWMAYLARIQAAAVLNALHVDHDISSLSPTPNRWWTTTPP